MLYEPTLTIGEKTAKSALIAVPYGLAPTIGAMTISAPVAAWRPQLQRLTKKLLS